MPGQLVPAYPPIQGRQSQGGLPPTQSSDPSPKHAGEVLPGPASHNKVWSTKSRREPESDLVHQSLGYNPHPTRGPSLWPSPPPPPAKRPAWQLPRPLARPHPRSSDTGTRRPGLLGAPVKSGLPNRHYTQPGRRPSSGPDPGRSASRSTTVHSKARPGSPPLPRTWRHRV